MPAKTKTVFVCSQCGYTSPKWAGKCSGCGEWNTMQEEIVSAEKSKPMPESRISKIAAAPVKLKEIEYFDHINIKKLLKLLKMC